MSSYLIGVIGIARLISKPTHAHFKPHYYYSSTIIKKLTRVLFKVCHDVHGFEELNHKVRAMHVKFIYALFAALYLKCPA